MSNSPTPTIGSQSDQSALVALLIALQEIGGLSGAEPGSMNEANEILWNIQDLAAEEIAKNPILSSLLQ